MPCYICDTCTWQRRSIFIRGKPILLLERMLHKEYNCKHSVAKKSLVVNLKGLAAKANWFAVNRQSWSNCDSEITNPNPVYSHTHTRDSIEEYERSQHNVCIGLLSTTAHFAYDHKAFQGFYWNFMLHVIMARKYQVFSAYVIHFVFCWNTVHSLFTNRPAIPRYIIWATDSVVTRIANKHIQQEILLSRRTRKRLSRDNRALLADAAIAVQQVPCHRCRQKPSRTVGSGNVQPCSSHNNPQAAEKTEKDRNKGSKQSILN
jgi:hypothetical protein